MSSLISRFDLTASLLVLTIMKYVNRRRALHGNGVYIEAQVIDIQVKQDWREGEGWSRDAWSGDLKREKTWQTYYEVTAQWLHPHTGALCHSRTRLWAKDCMSKPVVGAYGTVCFDPKAPERSRFTLQSAQDLLSVRTW